MTLLEKLGITPGPWKWANDEITDNTGRTSDISDIVYINCENEYYSGNARIIAQAPAMLEALIGMCIDMETYGSAWVKGIEIIEEATEKTWDEIKEIL